MNSAASRTTDPLQCTLEQAHKDWIYCIALTRDDKFLVSGSWDKTIKIWDFKEKKVLHTFKDAHKGYIMNLLISYDDQHIVSCSEDKTIKIWNIESRALVHTISNCHSEAIRAIKMTLDDKYLVSAGDDNSIKVWDFNERELVTSFINAHEKTIDTLSITTNGKYICSGSWDETIKIFDMDSKKVSRVFEKAHEGPVTNVLLTKNSRKMISTGHDLKIKIWDTYLRKCIHTFEDCHTDKIRKIVLTRDDRYLISVSDDHSIKFWDLEEKICVNSIKEVHSGQILSLTLTKDAKTLVTSSSDKTIKIWNVTTYIDMPRSLIFDSEYPRSNSNSPKMNPISPVELRNQIGEKDKLIKSLQKRISELEDANKTITEEYKEMESKNKLADKDIQKLKKFVRAGPRKLSATFSSKEYTFMTKRVSSTGNGLFHAVAYACEPLLRTEMQSSRQNRGRIAQSMKKLVSFNLLKDQTDYFRESFKEMPLDTYIKTMEGENFNGGDLELFALSRHYLVEFYVLEASMFQTSKKLIAGDIDLNKRVYLLLDKTIKGSEHYEVIIGKDELADREFAIFDAEDSNAKDQAFSLAKDVAKTATSY